MPDIGKAGSQIGGVDFSGVHVFQQTLTPALVAANTTAEQTFTVAAADIPAATAVAAFVSKPSAQAGLGIVNVRVVSATQIAITFSNNTAAGITPTSETYTICLVYA